jgi:hypothetical protein
MARARSHVKHAGQWGTPRLQGLPTHAMQTATLSPQEVIGGEGVSQPHRAASHAHDSWVHIVGNVHACMARSCKVACAMGLRGWCVTHKEWDKSRSTFSQLRCKMCVQIRPSRSHARTHTLASNSPATPAVPPPPYRLSFVASDTLVAPDSRPVGPTQPQTPLPTTHTPTLSGRLLCEEWYFYWCDGLGAALIALVLLLTTF